MQEAGCLCGKIRYRVSKEPSDVINCHCKFCQRATGGAYMVETLFSKNDFETIAGEPRVYEHISEGSGKTIQVNFCENCGTKISLTFERFPSIIGVYSGTFDDPNWFKRTPDNTQYFFLREAPDGTVIPAEYKVFDAHDWESEGVASTPQIFDAHTVVSPEVRVASNVFAEHHNKNKDE